IRLALRQVANCAPARHQRVEKRPLGGPKLRGPMPRYGPETAHIVLLVRVDVWRRESLNHACCQQLHCLAAQVTNAGQVALDSRRPESPLGVHPFVGCGGALFATDLRVEISMDLLRNAQYRLAHTAFVWS